jgi:glycosyltransferase involved in cell wall biosynthesis
MTSLPYVTIVVPAYNQEKYLDETIQSILHQDYKQIELIVIDDGSQDNTKKILQKYNHQFYYASQANIGQANTLNKGWNIARGEILSYLSADDLIMPNAVSTAVQYLNEDPNIVLTYCDFNLIDPNSKTIRKVSAPEFDYLEMVKRLICQPGPGVFFRKRAFDLTGGWNPEFRQMPDYDYWLRLGLNGPFKRIPQILASFRVHDQSMTFSKGDRTMANEPVRILETYYRSHKNLPRQVVEVYPKAMSNAHLISAQLHLKAGRWRDTLAAIMKAAQYSKTTVMSTRSLHILINALFNRTLHRTFWTIRERFSSGTPSPNH